MNPDTAVKKCGAPPIWVTLLSSLLVLLIIYIPYNHKFNVMSTSLKTMISTMIPD